MAPPCAYTVLPVLAPAAAPPAMQLLLLPQSLLGWGVVAAAGQLGLGSASTLRYLWQTRSGRWASAEHPAAYASALLPAGPIPTK